MSQSNWRVKGLIGSSGHKLIESSSSSSDSSSDSSLESSSEEEMASAPVTTHLKINNNSFDTNDTSSSDSQDSADEEQKIKEREERVKRLQERRAQNSTPTPERKAGAKVDVEDEYFQKLQEIKKNQEQAETEEKLKQRQNSENKFKTSLKVKSPSVSSPNDSPNKQNLSGSPSTLRKTPKNEGKNKLINSKDNKLRNNKKADSTDDSTSSSEQEPVDYERDKRVKELRERKAQLLSTQDEYTKQLEALRARMGQGPSATSDSSDSDSLPGSDPEDTAQTYIPEHSPKFTSPKTTDFSRSVSTREPTMLGKTKKLSSFTQTLKDKKRVISSVIPTSSPRSRKSSVSNATSSSPSSSPSSSTSPFFFPRTSSFRRPQSPGGSPKKGLVKGRNLSADVESPGKPIPFTSSPQHSPVSSSPLSASLKQVKSPAVPQGPKPVLQQKKPLASNHSKGGGKFEEISKQHLLFIFSWLTPEELVCVSRVQKKWRAVSLENRLWVNFFSVTNLKKNIDSQTNSSIGLRDVIEMRMSQELASHPDLVEENIQNKLDEADEISWYDISRIDDWRQIYKMSWRRNKVAREIVESERSYVNNLKIIVDVFINPLRDPANKQLISKDERMNIFSNLEVILNMNSKLLKDLEKRFSFSVIVAKIAKVDEDDEDDDEIQDEDTSSNNNKPTFGQELLKNVDLCFGDIFVEIISFLKLYTSYINSFNQAIQVLDRLKKNKKNFADWLNYVQGSKKARGHQLLSLLIMPVQRIPRYVLLLKDLLNSTHPLHADYVKILISYLKMKELADYMNRKKKDSDKIFKMMSIAEKLIFPKKKFGKNEFLIPGRNFIYEKRLVVIKGTKSGADSPPSRRNSSLGGSISQNPTSGNTSSGQGNMMRSHGRVAGAVTLRMSTSKQKLLSFTEKKVAEARDRKAGRGKFKRYCFLFDDLILITKKVMWMGGNTNKRVGLQFLKKSHTSPALTTSGVRDTDEEEGTGVGEDISNSDKAMWTRFEVLECIDLNVKCIVRKADKEEKFGMEAEESKNLFVVVDASGGKFVLMAKNKAERDGWIKKIKRCLAILKEKTDEAEDVVEILKKKKGTEEVTQGHRRLKSLGTYKS